MNIAIIDPGLANTAVLIYDGTRIIAAKTLKTPGDGYRTDFEAALVRARKIADQVAVMLVLYKVGRVVIESYRDIPGALRGARNRWSTPLCIGVITCRIDEFGIPITWQDPETVMKRYKPAKALWASKRHGLIPGDDIISNDHERSAGCHLLAYLERVK